MDLFPASPVDSNYRRHTAEGSLAAVACLVVLGMTPLLVAASGPDEEPNASAMEVNAASVADAVAKLANYEATFKFERVSLSQSGAATEVVTGTGTSLRFGEFVRSETRVNISRNGGEPSPARTLTIFGEDGLTLWDDSIGVPGAIGFRQVPSVVPNFKEEMKGVRSTGSLIDPLDRVIGAW